MYEGMSKSPRTMLITRKSLVFHDFWQKFCMYEGVSKSPRTMLITRKSLVFHDFWQKFCMYEGVSKSPRTILITHKSLVFHDFWQKFCMYEGMSKSPRTMLITRKSLVFHEFPARVRCGGVLWVSVPSGVVGCGSVSLLHVSLCVYCISRLRSSHIGGMAEVDEQMVCIKFGVRLGKTGSETFEMLKQAFGDSCMSHIRTFERFGHFKNGRNSTANDVRSGWPSTATTPSKVEQVRAAVNQESHLTIHDLCAEVGIGYGSCQRILTEQLNMHRTAAKFVPRVLTQDQKDRRVAICQELKETMINVPTLILNVITGDESIVYAYDPETTLQSSEWKIPGSPRPKNHVCKEANWRRCWFVSLTKRGSYTGNLSHMEWRSMQTSTLMFYEGNVKMCGASVHRNGKTRTSLSTTTMPRLTGVLKFRSFWRRTTWRCYPSTNLLDLAPCDFFLFPKLKLRMKGRRFDTIEEIQQESQRVLDTVPKRVFQGCFQAWQKRWNPVFVQKGSTLNVMEEFNIKCKQTSFYKYCPGTFGYILYVRI